MQYRSPIRLPCKTWVKRGTPPAEQRAAGPSCRACGSQFYAAVRGGCRSGRARSSRAWRRVSSCMTLAGRGARLGGAATRTRWRCISASSLARRALAAPSCSESEGDASEIEAGSGATVRKMGRLKPTLIVAADFRRFTTAVLFLGCEVWVSSNACSTEHHLRFRRDRAPSGTKKATQWVALVWLGLRPQI